MSLIIFIFKNWIKMMNYLLSSFLNISNSYQIIIQSLKDHMKFIKILSIFNTKIRSEIYLLYRPSKIFTKKYYFHLR
jgi:phage-related protein